MPNVTFRGRQTMNQLMVNDVVADRLIVDSNVDDLTPWPGNRAPHTLVPPLTVTSTAMVPNLNVGLLHGQTAAQLVASAVETAVATVAAETRACPAWVPAADPGYAVAAETRACPAWVPAADPGYVEATPSGDVTVGDEVAFSLDADSTVTSTVTFGTVVASGLMIASDDRCKHNEQDLDGALDALAQLRPMVYDKGARLDGDDADAWTREAGFIAQHVAQIPELAPFVREGDEHTKYHLDYNSLLTHAVAAIQQLSARVAALEGA